MLKFLDGFRSVLLMSAAGVAEPAGGGGAPPALAAAPAAPAAAPAADANKAWSFPTEKAFAEYLPDAYKADANFRDIKDFDGLLKSFVGARKMTGLDKANLLPIPSNDDAKDWDAVYNKLGRPESADKYEIPKPGEGKEYSEADKAMQTALLPILHKAGVTQRQLAAIVPAWNALAAQAGEATAKQEKDAIAAADADLTKEWGAAKDSKIAIGKEALTHFTTELKLGDTLTKALEAKDANGNALGNNPALLKLFAHFGAQLKEDGLIGKGGGGGAGEYSPAEAQQQINAKRNDADFQKVYRDKKNPAHADAVAEMQRLYEQAYPADK